MTLTPDMTFRVAASEWLRQRAAEVSPKTATQYRCMIRKLTLRFGDIQLRSVDLDMINSYQKHRSKSVGPSAINHEINSLAQVLNDAGLWEDIKPSYHSLPVYKRTRTILTEEQELALFNVASSRPRWRVAYLGSILVAATGLRAGQIRELQIGSLDLENSRIRVLEHKWLKRRGATQRKRPVVERWVPLDEAGYWAAQQLLDRALEIGVSRDDSFLLPANAKEGSVGYDHSRHQAHWRTAWEQIRIAVGIPNLQTEDLRFSAITRILRNAGVPQPAHPKIAAEGKAMIADGSAVPPDPSLVPVTGQDESRVDAGKTPPSFSACTICPKCRRKANMEDRFCARCGKRLMVTVVCAACGGTVQLTDAFCRSCGREQNGRRNAAASPPFETES